MSSVLRRLPVCAPVLLSGLLLAATPVASASSPLPPSPYAPPRALSALAGPYVLWSIAERDGKPVRLECPVQLTLGDIGWGRDDDGTGPDDKVEIYYKDEQGNAETAREGACSEPVFKSQGVESTRVGGWSVGLGGSIIFLQAREAEPMDFRPLMVAGEYALAGGKVYLTALRAPSKAGPEIASPLGGPGFGYEATSPEGWAATLDPATASMRVTAPGTPAEPDRNLSILPAGQAVCFVTRTPRPRFGGMAASTQDKLNEEALKEAAAAGPAPGRGYPIRAPNLKVEAVALGSIVAVRRTLTGPGSKDLPPEYAEPLVQIDLDWSTPDFSISTSCASGTTLDAPLGQAISGFITALVPDTR
jgi:hypothetical protein